MAVLTPIDRNETVLKGVDSLVYFVKDINEFTAIGCRIHPDYITDPSARLRLAVECQKKDNSWVRVAMFTWEGGTTSGNPRMVMPSNIPNNTNARIRVRTNKNIPLKVILKEAPTEEELAE